MDWEILMIDTNGRHLIWRRLAEHGAREADRGRVMKEIAALVAGYSKGVTAAKRASKEKQKESAKQTLVAIEHLVIAIQQADESIQKRFYRKLAPQGHAGKAGRAGKAHVKTMLASLASSATYAMNRAAKKKSGRGQKTADAPLHFLIVKLAEIWERETGKPFRAARKEGRTSVKAGAPRRFIETVLHESLKLTLKRSALTTRLEAARDELVKRRNRSEESEQSEQDFGDEC